MGVPTITPYVAGNAVLASGPNTNEAAIVTEMTNNLDRNNIKVDWKKHSIQRHWYKLTAAGTTVNLDIILGTTTDAADVRAVAIGYAKAASSANRTIIVKRFTIATGADANTLDTVAVPLASTSGYHKFTQAAVVPGTYGLRITYTVAAGTWDAEEWATFDVWIADYIAATTEL